MNFYPNERIAIFIDGANLYSTLRQIGLEVDYRKLLAQFSNNTRLIRANYYTAMWEEQDYSALRPLVDWLDYNGFNVIKKPAREQIDAQGKRRLKGNMDVDIAVDMLEMAPHIDHAVLFSGDGDFRRLVEAVQRKGVRVSVVSTLRATPPVLADELRRQADVFIDLADLAPDIARS
ncbi:MAG: NYN domain-containing protein [Caulobacterales bacterium]